MLKLIAILLPSLLMVVGLFETFIYLRVRKFWNKYPVVAGEIIYSRLIDHVDLNGKNEIGAIIKYKYNFRGQEYEAETPVLKGYDLFPSRTFYRSLVDRNRPGDIVNIKVVPRVPELGYLEIAPLSKVSTILAPVISLVALGLILAYTFGATGLVVEIVNFYLY